MDPNAILDRIADLLRRSVHDDEAGIELDEACQDLYDWIARGGFEPDWDRHRAGPNGSAAGYYECRAVHHAPEVGRLRWSGGRGENLPVHSSRKARGGGRKNPCVPCVADRNSG